MNNIELKLTEYLHSIIEENISLRNENDRIWKQKLEYIDRIDKAINYIENNYDFYYGDELLDDYNEIIKILRSKE